MDLAIEHQFNEQIAPILSAHLLEAGIPLIAMGAAHAGATYFGGNNYRAGFIGGRALGEWAKKTWKGQAVQLVLVEMSIAGPLLRSRMTGVENGVKEELPHLQQVVKLEGHGAIRRHARTGAQAPAPHARAAHPAGRRQRPLRAGRPARL